MSFTINLPMPPSLNHANSVGTDKAGKIKFYPSEEKRKFIKDADDMMWEQQRQLKPVRGPFTFHITLNEKLRNPLSDGDNRGKYVLDFLQRIHLIDNDKFAQSGSWSWGQCEHGCQVVVTEFDPVESRRVPETVGTQESV